MQGRGFDLFDLYVWRYYRSGGFRPLGAKPYQAKNVHSYIFVFHKPIAPKTLVKNRPVRYRPRLVEKLQKATRPLDIYMRVFEKAPDSGAKGTTKLLGTRASRLLPAGRVGWGQRYPLLTVPAGRGGTKNFSNTPTPTL